MRTFTVTQIGTIHAGSGGFSVELSPAYRPALRGLDGFGWLNILWWFDCCDNEAARGRLEEQSPYVRGPEVLGTFATRSPERPNPIALSCAEVTYLDARRGILGLAYLDAQDGSPVLDIKPYTPSLDRVERPRVPGWCAHWPASVEQGGDFDWGAEFNF